MAKKTTPAKKARARKAAEGDKPKTRVSKAGGKSAVAKAPKAAKPDKPKVKAAAGVGSEPEAAGGGLRETLYVLNVLSPGKKYRREAKKYWLAREAMLKLLPTAAPGLTQAEMSAKMRAMLSPQEFPGTTSSWWMKTAQLDLEARGMVARDDGKPLRWIRVGRG